MEIVLISKSNGALARFRVGWLSLTFSLSLVAIIAGSILFFGYQQGSIAISEKMSNDADYTANFWQSEIVKNKQFLQNLRGEFGADLSALSGRVGTLQAHIARLDALAERLIGVANLDTNEFLLEETPGVGGPQSNEVTTPQWRDLLINLESLGEEIALREDRLEALDSLLMDRQLKEDMFPAGNPVKEGWISSRFGYRTDPVTGSREFHGGIDFAGRSGLDVHSVGGGIVTWSGKRWGYGNLVEINHGDGYVTRYAHNRKNLVKIGEKVSKEQTIALLGSTGRSTGPHVHFEVLKDGKVVDPRNFVR